MSATVLQRNWAKGQRKEFLTSHIEGYQDALRQNRAKGPEYVDMVVNSYFARFHWKLPLSEDPPAILPNDPPMDEEELSEEDKIQKGQVISRMKKSIYAWLDYRAKKIDKTLIRGRSEGDPFALLLGNLTGQGKKPGKLLAGWQHWSKAHFEEHKAAFDAQFKESGADEKQRATARQTYTRALFNNLPKEDQDFHNQAAVSEHASAVQAYKEAKGTRPSGSPADYQSAIQRLGSFVYPIIEGIAEATGMHVSILIGGPEPENGGQINVISMHQGVNKGAVPKDWKMWDRRKFKIVTNLFTEYLEECYSKSERDARAIPSSKTPKSVTTLSDGEANGDTDNDKDEGPSTVTSTKRKRTAKRPKTANRSRRQATSGEDGSTSDMSHTDEEAPCPSQKKVVVTSTGKVVRHLPFQALPRRASVKTVAPARTKRHPRPRPVRAKMASAVPTLTVTPLMIPADATAPALPTTFANNASLIDETSFAAVAREPTNIASPATPGTQDATMADFADTAGEVTSSVPVTPLSVTEASEPWPAWFDAGFSALKAASLGPRWTRLLDCFVRLEACSRFVNPKGLAHALGAKHRPGEVDWWIGRGRKRSPPVKDCDALARKFWTWWKALQPEWREVAQVTGWITSAHRVVTGDWAVLDKPGQNGFLSVMAVLSWWGQAVLVQEEVVDPEWLAACEDVEWVMESLVLVPVLE